MRSGVSMAAVLSVGLVLAAQAHAQTLYRYVDKNGKIVYSDKPLTDLTGRQVDQLNKQGTVVKRTPAEPTPEERAAIEEERRRAAELAKQRERETRRDVALLATYTSAKGIDEAHAFATREPLGVIRESEAKLVEAEKRRDQLKADLEAKKGNEAVLRQQLGTNDAHIKALNELLVAKRRDMQAINDRFEEDKRRYGELVRSRNAALVQTRDNPPAQTRR